MYHKVNILLITRFLQLITIVLLTVGGVLAQTCTGSLGDPVVNVSFGTGSGFTTLPTAASGASTTYTNVSNNCPNDGNYAVTNSTSGCFSNSWFTLTEDHTPADVNGRMAIFNASYTVGEFYKQTVSGLCGSTTYEFAAWMANILTPTACSSAGIDPNLTFRIESLTGTLLGSYSTGNIAESNALTWKQYGFVFTTPAGQTQVILKIINNAPGGCGNDLALDDITFRPCGPTISVNANVPSICEGGSVNLSGSISPGYISPQFQWQQSSDNGATWVDISGATSLNTSVSSAPAGTKYRLLAAEQGNIGIGYCRIASNPVALTVYAIPKLTLPTSSAVPLEYCAGISIDLTDFSSVPSSTFSWQLNNTAIGLNQSSGSGQVPVFTAANTGNSPITGTFTVTGSANGCISQSQSFSVIINPKPAVSLGADQIICVGNTATLNAAASGGTPSYTYSWDNGLLNNASQMVSPSSTVTYNVTVTDTKGCKATDDIKVTVNQAPTFTALTKTDALCYGQANGSITVTAGGTGPFQYRLDNNAYQTGNTFAVAAGTYTVTIKDANGCTASKTINLNQPNPMTADVTVKNVSCFDGTDGAITVNTNGGKSPYSYFWSDGTTGGNSIVGRPAGTYTVTVTDGNGCTTTAQAVITEPVQISITGNTTHVTCNGLTNGKIDITAQSITSIKSYEWKNSAGTIIAITEDVINLSAGTYTVTVTDADGCKLSTAYTVTQPTAANVSAAPANTTCFGGNDGKITVSASGGTGTLQYALCSGSNCTAFGANQTSNLFSNLTVGTYRIRVTDANGCSTITTNIPVSQAAQLVASPSNTSPVCAGTNVTLSAANAGTGVNYEWTGPNGGIVANTQQFSINNAQALNAGIYTLRVYTAAGCQNTATTLVKVNSLPDVNAGTDQTICEGTTVTLNASTSGGFAPYSYTWNNALGSGALKTTTPSFTTDYIVSVSDTNGCTDSDTIRVNVIAKPQTFTLISPNDVTICAGINGIPLTLSSSQTGVLYELIKNNSNIGQGKMGTGSSLALGNYFGGTYQVKATTNTLPACAVMMNGSVTVNELPPITAELQSLDDTVCIGESMQYTVVASGGSGTGYTYTWQDGQTGNLRSFTTTEYLLVEVTISDSRGCTLKRAADLRAVKPIAIDITTNPNPICAGQQVALNATATGGTGNLKYEWENASTNPSRIVSPNTTTTYNVIVTDTKEGCFAQKSVTVTVNPQPTAFNLTGGGAYCTGSNGVPVGLSGSETGFMYQLKRNGQNIGSAVSGTGSALNFGNQTGTGTYTVDVFSNTLPVCTATMTGSVAVFTKTKPEISASASPTTVCAGKVVNLTTTPAITNALYTWTGPNGFTSSEQNPVISSATVSNSGTYTVIVSVDGCSDTSTVTLQVNPAPIASITGPTNLCKENPVTLNGNPSNGTSPYTHNWQVISGNNLLTLTNNNNGTATITPTGMGTATLTYQVTDANGCQSPVVNYSLGINAALPSATVSAGAPVGFTSLLGVRYQAFNRPSEKEIYLGIPDLGIAPPHRTQADLTWKTGNNDITFEYDPASDQLKTTVINSAGTFTLTYPNVAASINSYLPGQNICAMNVLQLMIGSQNEPTGTVASNNVVLNGDNLGNFSGAGFNDWTVRNSDFGLGFKLTGTIVLSGTQPTSAETNKVELLVGNDQTPMIFGCMSANEVCEGQKSTVSFSGLRPNTTFNIKYSIGTTGNLTTSVTTDSQGNGTFLTASLANVQNGATLKIDSVQRAITGACFQPITANNTTVLTVNPNPIVTISTAENSGLATDDGILCEGEAVTLTATGGGTYNWISGAASPAITVIPTATTNYSVTITSAKGCQTTVSKLITVHPKPQPTASNTSPVCAGDKITLSATGGTGYEWKNAANAVVATNSTFSIDNAVATNSGIYSVKVTDGNGCSQTASTEVVVKALPIAQASSNSPKCSGQTLTLNAANAGTGAIYAWSGANGFSRTNEQNPIIANAQPIHSGKYLLTVTKNGCSSTDDVDVVIYENPVAEALSNSPVCEDSPLNFTAKDAGAGAQYQWRNATETIISPNASFTIFNALLTDNGKYYLTVTKNNCSSSDTIEVLVRPVPKVTINKLTPLCAGLTIQLYSETSPGATRYEWSGPNGFTSPDQNPKIENSTTNATGIYEVIASLNGCRDTSRIQVTVNPKPTAVASASQPVCENGTVTLTAANAGIGAQYEWQNPAGAIVSTGPSFVIQNATVSNAGSYKLKVTLGLCSSEDTALVVVYPKPKLTIVGAFCAPNLKSYTVNLTAEEGDVATSGGFLTRLTATSYSISNILPTVNPLIITVTSDKGCTLSQNVPAPDCSCPTVNAPVSNGDKQVCAGQPLPTLTASVGTNETVDWYETASGGTPILTGSTHFIPQAAGTYYAQTRNLIHDCVSSSRTAITLTSVPLPRLVIDSTVCAQDLSNFVIWLTTETSAVSVSSTDGIAVSFGNGHYEILVMNPGGSPTLTVTVTNLEGCEQKIIVTKPNCLCPDLVAPKNNGDKEICENTPIPTLNVTVDPNETVDWYDAPVGGNKIATATLQFTPTETLAGTYTFYAETRRTDITVRTCVSNTRTAVKLTIKPLPVVNAASNSALCQGEDLQLETPANAGATYQWIGPNGFSSLQRSPLRPDAQPNISGDYIVMVTLNGCISKDTATVLIKPLPVVTAAGVIVCENSPFTLSANAIANATYEWTTPTNQVVSVNSSFVIPNSTFSDAGTYKVKMTVDGCSQTDTANVIIKSLPLAQALTNSPVCADDTLTLTAADAGIGATYLWKNPEGIQIGNQSKFSKPHSLTTDSGKYILTVTKNGCSATDTITVLVQPLPTFTIGSNSPLCFGDTIKLFTNNPPAGSTFEWSGANDFVSFQQNPVITQARPALSGLYQVTVTLNGCVKTDTLTFKVNPLPVAKILSNTPICENDTLHFTAENAGIGASYEWRKLGESVVGNSQQFTVNNSQLINSGKYILKVTLNNCVNYDTIEVMVKKRPLFTLSSNSPVCEGDTLRFFATGAPAGTAFVWSGPQQFMAIDSVAIRSKATLSMAGLYELTATLNGCTFADTIRAAIKPLPAANAVSNSPVCEGETLELSTTAVNNATYIWKNPNGDVISTNSQFTVNHLQLNAGGNYSVLVTLNGCKNSDTVNVQVKPKPTFSIDSVLCAPSLKFYTIYGKSNGTVSALQGTVAQNGAAFTVSGITIETQAVITFTKDNCDSVFKVNSPNCQCPSLTPAVTPENQTICSDDTLQTLHAIVSPGATADWYDAPTGGNLLASGTLTFKPSSAGKLYVEARVEESGCLSTKRAVSEVLINPIPSFTAATVGTSCNGLEAIKDGKLQISEVINGKRFDFSVGSTYMGNKTYATAKSIPANGLLADTLSNPAIRRDYTVRVFDSTGCFTDRVATLLHRDCICPTPPFVVPESQSICDGDTLRTIRGFVEPGITVDWYDEQGNLLKKGSVFFKPTQAGIYYAEARDTVSGCKGLVRVPSYAFINPHPSFQAVVTRGTCNGTEVVADAKITLLEVKNGKRYDYNVGKTYAGNKTYDTATDLPADGIVLKNLANPVVTTFYSFRVFDSTGCFTDSVVVFEPRICECPRPPFVVPESQAICSGDTLRTVKGFVDSGVTVDWYDAPTGGNLLKKGSIFFKPNQAGVYYAEARDTTNNCKGIVRVPSYAFVNDLPSFDLEVQKSTCVDFIAQNNGLIRLKNLKNGTKYDFSVGNSYTGDKTFDTAKDIPADSILFNQVPNPISNQTYTVRIFGEPNCSTDKTITITPVDCGCKTPSFDLVVTRGTCNGTEVSSDAKITLVDVKNGKRYDYTKNRVYTGGKTYSNAVPIPTNGIILTNLANPVTTEFYTVRVFDSTGCFTDSTIAFEPRICECPHAPFVVPESQVVCSGDTLRTVKAFVDSGITVDWYDAPTGGNLLKKNNIFFKPTQGGVYYAEARDTLTNCKATIRVPSYAFVNELPSFTLSAEEPSCLQNTPQNNGMLRLKGLRNGTKYDVSVGNKYTGDKTFDSALEVPIDSILVKNINNSALNQTYTVRIFGEPHCFTDQTITIAPTNCNCQTPSFELIVTRGTCNGTEVLPDAKITLLEVKNGKRFDYTKGKTYTGNKLYENAAVIPADGIVVKNIVNPATTEFYTFRVFDVTGCSTDSTIAFEPRICECPHAPFVVPESQVVCSGDTLRTVKAFVDSGITVDWYDAPTGGNLLKKNNIFFKPTQAGTYYAEARDTLTNCKATIRVPSYAFVNELPIFALTAEKPSCLQNTAQNDGKIRVKNLKNGTRYDYSMGNLYRGNKTFNTALDIPGDSVLIKEVSNPASNQIYTVRIFGEPNCFTDHTITVSHFDCNCSPINVSVLSASFSICEGEPFPVLQGFVDSGVTIDWYDEAGNLRIANSLTYQPTAFGEFYAEGRSLSQNGCVSANRTKATVTKIDKPTFTLTSRPATCLGDSAASDARIIIENLKEGERFDYSAGSTYTGNLTYENAHIIPPNGELVANLPNTTQIYTIRVFNRCGAFKDISLQLTKNECSCGPSACVPLKMKMKKKKPVL
jgi:hypothetical protein